MADAFQANAFQNDAFQIESGLVCIPAFQIGAFQFDAFQTCETTPPPDTGYTDWYQLHRRKARR